MNYNVCSFTGHRKIKKDHEDKISDLLGRAVNFAYDKGCRNFLAGGAIGFDTLAAKEVLRLRESHPDARLVLVLPCKDQTRGWTEEQKAAYGYVLSRADEVIYVSEQYTDTCIKERNMRLAKEADILISYVGYSRSGSAQTARMAASMKKEIYNLYPTLEKKI